MTARAWLYVLFREMRAQRARLAILFAALVLTCAVCGIAFHALLYTRLELRPHLRQLFPEQRLLVRPGDFDLAFLKVEVGKISPEALESIRALPGIKSVHPQMPVEFPVMAQVDIETFDIQFDTDVIVLGVPAELIAGDLPEGASFEWDPASVQPVPVAVSAYFLDMYNLGLAESAGLPKLSRAAAIGRTADLVLGESTLAISNTPAVRQPVRIVGLVSNPHLMGLIAPIDVVRDWNAQFNPGKPPKYGLLFVDVESHASPDAVAQAIRQMGFKVDRPSESAEGMRRAVGAFEAAVVLAGLFVLLLAGVGIVSTMAMAMRERRAAWGLYRATGLAPAALLALLAAEIVLVALAAALAAWGVDAALAWVARNALQESIAPLASLPGHPLTLAPAVPALLAALAGVLLALPALLQALPMLRDEPARLLEERNI